MIAGLRVAMEYSPKKARDAERSLRGMLTSRLGGEPRPARQRRRTAQTQYTDRRPLRHRIGVDSESEGDRHDPCAW